jgi:hypothetical protein
MRKPRERADGERAAEWLDPGLLLLVRSLLIVYLPRSGEGGGDLVPFGTRTSRENDEGHGIKIANDPGRLLKSGMRGIFWTCLAVDL